MKNGSLWENAKELNIQVSGDITGGFDLGFDAGIPEETKDALIRFAYWVEDHYALPVTLWVDFKNKHYLIDQNKRRVQYRFYWVDFENYPVFQNPDDIPVIELPVKAGRQTMEEILTAFTEAVTHYFAWLANMPMHDFRPDHALVGSILQRYLSKDNGE